MSRVIKISKVNNITLVTVVENGDSKISYSSIRRVVSKEPGGVIIEPNSEEPEFNNFYIPLDELEDTFGAKDADGLIAEFAARGFFSGAANSNTPGANINQNNKIKVIELPGIIVPPNTSFEDALATQLNEYSDLDVKEDEILIVKVGRFIQGGPGPGEGK
ncbi:MULTISPECIES: hypothetical protein [unclassified Tenacibaculum]|uniref:hypothetical protein n=1 Tax=unclassified Tenacibaculum TaxID=2635139 RepID=UPI001F16E3B6|nr:MULTISPECIES: hypothetical protein [unclassified Tenacibaculum]MCF2875434.1 hypothetical protein [Tenacibaculum sp. Cn5-1]MCF2935510.1 hypothetical protein [Tenacibaculum sp. Cn5-34]MCG7512070.1 hypothetical protein [Tenacibaculum sp. Cn5-46]